MKLRVNCIIAGLCGMMFLISMLTGCGTEVDGNKSLSEQQILNEKLQAIPLSSELRLNDSIQNCNYSQAESFLDSTLNVSTASAGDFWGNCQNLYACSPESKQVLHSLFTQGSGQGFNLGIADIQSIHVTHSKWQPHGLYWVGTQNVYLDEHIKSPLQACAVLLHEIVHRFSPGNLDKFHEEYRSYYYQRYFLERLPSASPELSKKVLREKREFDGFKYKQYTREELAYAVATIVGANPSVEEVTVLVQKYPPLPWEKGNIQFLQQVQVQGNRRARAFR